MDEELKEVRFSKYCKLCEYSGRSDADDPCNECLEVGMNVGTEVPVYWEERRH